MTDDEQIEALIEELAVKAAKREKGSIWSQFVPRHLKLHLAKQMINYTTPRLNKLIPTRKPECLVSKIVDRTFIRIREMTQKKNVNPALKDNNFTNLLDTTRRTLIFIAEEDVHYRAWLEALLLLIYQDVKTNVPGIKVMEEQLKKE